MEKTVYVGSRIRPYIENSARHGHTIFAVDGFCDADSGHFAVKSGGSLDGTAPAVWKLIRERWRKFENMPLLFCSPIEGDAGLIEEAAVTRKVLNSSRASVEVVRATSFLDHCAGGGIKIPPREYDGAGRWLVKNRHGAGGTHIRGHDGAPLKKNEYLQKHIVGDSIGVSFASSRDGTALLGVSRHINGVAALNQPEFSFGGLIYPADVDRAITPALHDFGNRVADGSDLRGLWGADFILTDEALWLLEINPRFTSSMELIANAHDIDLLGLQTALLAGDGELPVFEDPREVSGTAVVYAERDFIFASFAEWLRSGIRDVPREGSRLRKGEPVLSIYGVADDARSCLENIVRKWTKLRVSIGAERSNIA